MRKILDRRPVEVHLIVEDSGINRVQIIGRLDQHKKGHDLYMKIHSLIPKWDKEIQKALEVS